MPIYVYRCPQCGATFEKLEPYRQDPPLCHVCQEATCERIQAQTGPWKFGKGK